MSNYIEDIHASQSKEPPPWFDSAPWHVSVPHDIESEVPSPFPPANSADFVVPDQEPPITKPKTGVTFKDMIVRRPAQPNNNEPPTSVPQINNDPPPPHAWLDAYIEYSRQMSPEGYEHFHEACGIWLLSTVAARRIHFSLGESQEYTPLYFMLVAISTEFAKTETAKSITRVLKAAKLDWLLLSQEASPESFISELARTKLPPDFHELSNATQKRMEKRLLFAGQGGWLYDEFGNLIDGMMNERSYLASFKSLLRVFHNCPDHYERRTKAHGTEFISEPHLALIGLTTPSDLKRYAGRGKRLWNDGFWARFGMICPPPNAEPIHETRKYSTGFATVPSAVVQPLMDWHERLGQRLDPNDPLPQTQIHFSKSIWDHFDAFRLEVKQGRKNVNRTQHGATDLFSNESRMPMQCLAIAALLASVESGNVIEERHWRRARRFCGFLSEGVRNLYEMVNGGEPTKEAEQEDRVVRAIKKGRAKEKKKGRDQWPTEREIIKNIGSTMSRAQIHEHLMNLIGLGVVEPIQRTKRRKEYQILD